MELERIGDYAEGIGKISLMMGDSPPSSPSSISLAWPRSRPPCSAPPSALSSSATPTSPTRCLPDDDEVDMLYDQVYHELLLLMLSDPKVIERATYLLWAAHDLERIADRATNISEQVIYLVTGKMAPGQISKY